MILNALVCQLKGHKQPLVEFRNERRTQGFEGGRLIECREGPPIPRGAFWKCLRCNKAIYHSKKKIVDEVHYDSR